MDEALRLGVDLGGTKTEAVVVRLGAERFEELARVRLPTGRDGGYEHVLQTTVDVIARATRDAGLSAPPPIGVGMPGSVTTRRADGTRSDAPLVKNSNTICLNGRTFRADLVDAVGEPVAFANDANCFALAEATYGAARDVVGMVFGVILGTGVGGGLVVRRAGAPAWAWEGVQGIAGEWGHVVLDPDRGPACYCGKRGCVEQYLSGPALERVYRARSGTPRPLAEIALRRGDDPQARFVISELLEHFGRALATVIDVVDPAMVVLGGGVSNLDLLYDEGVASVARWVFNDELLTPIVRNSLGDSGGVIGAALLPVGTPGA